MLAALAVRWTFLVLGASIAAIFGTVVLVWPGLTCGSSSWCLARTRRSTASSR
jgi:hypothetical protein